MKRGRLARKRSSGAFTRFYRQAIILGGSPAFQNVSTTSKSQPEIERN